MVGGALWWEAPRHRGNRLRLGETAQVALARLAGGSRRTTVAGRRLTSARGSGSVLLVAARQRHALLRLLRPRAVVTLARTAPSSLSEVATRITSDERRLFYLEHPKVPITSGFDFGGGRPRRRVDDGGAVLARVVGMRVLVADLHPLGRAVGLAEEGHVLAAAPRRLAHRVLERAAVLGLSEEGMPRIGVAVEPPVYLCSTARAKSVVILAPSARRILQD